VLGSVLIGLLSGPLSALAQGDAEAPPGPERNVVFFVERDGESQGGFAEVEGLGSTTEVIEFREGGDNGVIRKLPGVTRFPDVTLKRGVTRTLDLWKWRDEVVSGAIARSTIVVTLVESGKPVARYVLENAWPSKITGPQLPARGNDIAIETLTLSHEGLRRTH
jgi:phage tail-like protein